jgi:hypothetical protein
MSDDEDTDSGAELEQPKIDDDLVLGPNSLARLTAIEADIRDAHSNFKKNAEQTAEWAVKIGRQLIEAKKDHLHHGQFGPWLKKNFDFTHSTALNYMRIAQRVDAGELKIANIAKMGIVAALRGVGERTDPVAREQRKVANAFEELRRTRSRWGLKAKREEPLAVSLARVESRAIARQQTIAEGSADDMEWPRPVEAHQTLVVKWEREERLNGAPIPMPRSRLLRTAYIWLPEHPSTEADARYSWLWVEHGRVEKEERRHFDVSDGGESWERVRDSLRAWSKRLGSGGKYSCWVSDPTRTAPLETFSWFVRDTKKGQHSPFRVTGCPHGHRFGKDNDYMPECDECNVWTWCNDARSAAKVAEQPRSAQHGLMFKS